MSHGRLRVALVAPGGFDPSGRHVIPALIEFVRQLSRAHEVHVFVLRYLESPQDYRLGDAMVHDLGRPSAPRGWKSLQQWPRLLRAIRRHGPFDVVHGYWAAPAGLMAAMAGRVLSTPSVVTCDSGEFTALPNVGYGLQRSWRGRTLVRAALASATCVHVCSDYMAALARALGWATTTIPLGVDVGRFREVGGVPALGERRTTRRLLHVASLNPVKGLSILLNAFAAIARERSDVYLDVVGEDTMAGRSQAECEALGIHKRVVFHGYQPTAALAAFYQQADLLVMPSHHEAAGVVVLEAAAAGLPTLGSAVGYVADWSPRAARAVAPNDVGALVCALRELLLDEGGRLSLAAAARDRVKAYDVAQTTEVFVQLYRRLGSPPSTNAAGS